jgi:hypothetical protein
MQIRNRIKAHCRVRASDLVPHEFNYRYHPGNQVRTLQALYQEIGFARSLLAYELPDGRLKLIDGHLRRELDPNMEVEVEVLDVTDEEARALLLSIDPLAQLAVNQEQLATRHLGDDADAQRRVARAVAACRRRHPGRDPRAAAPRGGVRWRDALLRPDRLPRRPAPARTLAALSCGGTGLRTEAGMSVPGVRAAAEAPAEW